MKPYEQTHQCFKFYVDFDVIKLCREHLGDNDPYELLQNRKWFTFPSNEIWIRNDCVDSTIVTFFALQQK